MLIKGFSFFIFSGHFDEGMGAIVAISVQGHLRNISMNYFEIEHLAFEKMSFKDFFYFKFCFV